MIKKAIITSLGVMLATGLLFGTSAVSYVKTAYNRVTTSVEESVPLEFQIDRARNLVQDLDPEIRNAIHVIAKEEIALERLNERIDNAESGAEKSKEEILRLQSDLQKDKTVFVYDRNYTRSEVTADLSRRFARHKVNDETIDHLTKMRDARARNLDAARQKLSALVSAQKQLRTDITNLEAQRQLLTVAQASSDLVIDDSRLAKAKELVQDIQTRLDVSAKLANHEMEYPSEIQLDATESSDVTEQVAAYFEQKKDSGRVASVSVKVD